MIKESPLTNHCQKSIISMRILSKVKIASLLEGTWTRITGAKNRPATVRTRQVARLEISAASTVWPRRLRMEQRSRLRITTPMCLRNRAVLLSWAIDLLCFTTLARRGSPAATFGRQIEMLPPSITLLQSFFAFDAHSRVVPCVVQ